MRLKALCFKLYPVKIKGMADEDEDDDDDDDKLL